MGDLLDIGAIFAAQPVDRVAILLGACEEAAIGHHDRARRIIGEAHVEQLADALVGRRGLGDHPVEQRGEFDQGQLVGEREGAVLRPKLRRHQEQPPFGVVELADIAELGLRPPRARSIPHASFSRRRIGSDIDNGSLSAPPSVSAACSSSG